MEFEVIENNIEGCGYFKAFFISGDPDALSLSFYKNIYPEISYLDISHKKLLDVFITQILNLGNDHLLFIDKIEIYPEYRGKGLAKKTILDILDEYSAEFSMLIASPILDDDSLSKDELVSFYESLDYCSVFSLDYDLGDVMVKL